VQQHYEFEIACCCDLMHERYCSVKPGNENVCALGTVGNVCAYSRFITFRRKNDDLFRMLVGRILDLCAIRIVVHSREQNCSPTDLLNACRVLANCYTSPNTSCSYFLSRACCIESTLLFSSSGLGSPQNNVVSEQVYLCITESCS
jgi:hypothetical protein